MDASTITGLLTLSGALAGGILGVAGKVIADVAQAKRDREIRREQRQSDFQRWQREQVLLLLTNSAKSTNLYATKAIGRDIVTIQNDRDAQQVSAELQGWLVALAAVYPDTKSTEYRQFTEKLDEALWKAVPDIDPVWKIRQLLVKLATRFGEGHLPGGVSGTV
jgi:hypothetical protein